MAEIIGKVIHNVAKSQGLNATELGLLINMTKQGVHSIFKRETIDTKLLALISEKLNFDFFKNHIYKTEPMLSFKKSEEDELKNTIAKLKEQLILQEQLLNRSNELIETQRKLLTQYEKTA